MWSRSPRSRDLRGGPGAGPEQVRKSKKCQNLPKSGFGRVLARSGPKVLKSPDFRKILGFWVSEWVRKGPGSGTCQRSQNRQISRFGQVRARSGSGPGPKISQKHGFSRFPGILDFDDFRGSEIPFWEDLGTRFFGALFKLPRFWRHIFGLIGRILTIFYCFEGLCHGVRSFRSLTWPVIGKVVFPIEWS